MCFSPPRLVFCRTCETSLSRIVSSIPSQRIVSRAFSPRYLLTFKSTQQVSRCTMQVLLMRHRKLTSLRTSLDHLESSENGAEYTWMTPYLAELTAITCAAFTDPKQAAQSSEAMEFIIQNAPKLSSCRITCIAAPDEEADTPYLDLYLLFSAEKLPP
jgi:hypothetical protein